MGVRIVEREDKGADKKPWGGPILRSQTRRLLRALRLRSGSKEENRRLWEGYIHNIIKFPTALWATHTLKNNYVAEILPHK